MQSAFMEQPLSPSSYNFASFINPDVMGDSDDPASSFDWFKPYLNLQQGKEMVQQQAPATLSLADIENWQAIFANQTQQQQPQQQPQANIALFPFAEAARNPIASSSTASTSGSARTRAFTPITIQQGSDQPLAFDFDALFPAQIPLVKPEPVEHALPKERASKKRAMSELALEHIDEEDEDVSDDDDDEDASDPDVAPPRKSGRKSSGSSTKRNAKKVTASTSPAASKKSAVNHPHPLVPVPEYSDRPSKAEYEKLSSKEKRQLRNKISARNFRHRRKAHIDTLEDQVDHKDRIIDGLKDEVGTLRSENQGLRADIEILKKNWESIASKISAAAVAPVASTSSSAPSILSPDEDDLYGAGSLPALSPPSSSASTNGDAESSIFDTTASTSSASTSTAQPRRSGRTVATAKPNLRKDISPRTGGSFYDSAASPFSYGFNRANMDVHTTFVPEMSIGSPAFSNLDAISGKVTKSPAPANFANLFAYGANMNSALNGLSDNQLSNLRDQFNSSSLPNGAAGNKKDHVAESFFETNPFLLLRHENLQDYRGQLYSKLANNAAGLQTIQAAAKNGNGASLQNSGLKPAFLASSSTKAGKEASIEQVTQVVGALATKTLFDKLSSAFWDAFTGDQPSKPLIGNAKKQVDGRKVADVLGGKSKLVVTPVDDDKNEVEHLERALGKLEIARR